MARVKFIEDWKIKIVDLFRDINGVILTYMHGKGRVLKLRWGKTTTVPINSILKRGLWLAYIKVLTVSTNSQINTISGTAIEIFVSMYCKSLKTERRIIITLKVMHDPQRWSRVGVCGRAAKYFCLNKTDLILGFLYFSILEWYVQGFYNV